MADPQHDRSGIGAPPALAPLVHLLVQIGRALAGERWVRRSVPLAIGAMTAGAGWQTACRIPAMIKRAAAAVRRARLGHLIGKAGVMERDGHALALGQLARDPGHLRMVPPPVVVGFQLPFQVSGIQPRQPGSASTIALALQPVAGEAGVLRACAGTAQRHQLATFRKAVERGGGRSRTAEQRRCRQAKDQCASHHLSGSTSRRKAGFRWALLSLTIASCKPPPDERQTMPTADAERGLRVIERVGCGSCHVIPGLYWPKGTVGPSLDGLADRALIAGKFPNRPDLLAAYIQNAPAFVPESGMPAMPVSTDEARDVAAYLYEKGQR